MFDDLQPGSGHMITHEAIGAIGVGGDDCVNDAVVLVKGVFRVSGNELKHAEGREPLPEASRYRRDA
jgi:hypothetical protein